MTANKTANFGDGLGTKLVQLYHIILHHVIIKISKFDEFSRDTARVGAHGRLANLCGTDF